MHRGASKTGLLTAIKAWRLGPFLPSLGPFYVPSLRESQKHLLGTRQKHHDSSKEVHQRETARSSDYRDLVQVCLKVSSSGETGSGMGKRCYHMTMTLNHEDKDELAFQKSMQRMKELIASHQDDDAEDQSKWQPIPSTENYVYSPSNGDDSPYASANAAEVAPEESDEEDIEEKEEREPEAETVAEPLQQQQPMGHSTLRVTASDGTERPEADNDLRFNSNEKKDTPRRPRDNIDPYDKLVRTDLQKHKEREYVGVYWTGQGERHDSRLDIKEDEDTGYVTGEGVPDREPAPGPKTPKK
ncbi:Hypothetical predicted protein [Drosophila guanche]|uniref:Uncharacterized protein n=1 Tax=Drosophila guanche TaxID=7266 RepID=A0A3B0KEE8_DROGU|nr:Hypothetical predicted protein [Drosophila guanche]